ncbi:MAG: VCBS repeat-containing protein [Proteobacteria bacterium]|nr:VCBS repeat-containing protein [Pseudomonadota bacterium]NOG59566.1 VCBS repeat-containing protein [Pseudomonadota bacterium]
MIGIEIFINRQKMISLIHKLVVGMITISAGSVYAGGEELEKGLSGKELVDTHCTRCHLAPEPTNLPREFWPIAVHYMSYYVGMQDVKFPELKIGPFPPEMIPADDYNHRYVAYDQRKDLMQFYWIFKSHMVTEPMMSEEEFRRIKDYFVENSLPSSDPRMELRNRKEPVLKGFTPIVPRLDLEPNSLVMATRVDTKRRRLYVGRSVIDDWYVGDEHLTDDLVALDLDSGERIGHTNLDSDPIEMSLTPTGVRLLTHGEFPIDHGNGLARVIDWEFEKGSEPKARMLVNGRHRFVTHSRYDLNNDGLEDMVTTGFGDGIWYDSGARLSIYWQTPEYEKIWKNAPAKIPSGPLQGALRETVLDELAGYIDSEIADINEDGKPDIVTLIAQGNQHVVVYLNEGNEKFSRHIVIKNPPSFGGNNITVKDYDGDGHLDIALVSGDNMGGNYIGNLIPSPRPRHGLRLFKNNGNLNFSEEYYYQMHGAIRTVSEDFDQDGDIDMAMIALFPLWNIEEPETFVYMENQGNWKFTTSTLPRDFFSVWCDIEAADVNGDQKLDIVLGLGNFPTLVPDDWLTRKIMKGRNGKAPSIVFLLNNN